MEAKPPSASRTETTHLVLPGETNVRGTIFGGFVMQWIDEIGAVAATRHASGPVVTAALDALQFIEPIQLGALVVMQAQVNAAFRSSMEVGVRVEVENPQTGERRQSTRAYLTFVAVDQHGKPQQLPALAPRSDDERRRQHEAGVRRDARLAARKR